MLPCLLLTSSTVGLCVCVTLWPRRLAHFQYVLSDSASGSLLRHCRHCRTLRLRCGGVGGVGTGACTWLQACLHRSRSIAEQLPPTTTVPLQFSMGAPPCRAVARALGSTLGDGAASLRGRDWLPHLHPAIGVVGMLHQY